MKEETVGFIFGIVIGVVFGVVIGIAVGTVNARRAAITETASVYQKQAIDRGYGGYNQKTGAWQWKEQPEQPKEQNQ